jgi:HD-GYP domain-containing protein (c-di-GMP phosphodiesterase class II)
MAYKAEQLLGFASSQWALLDELGFEEEPQYRTAATAAIESYARSLLRSETELIFALDAGGEVVMTTGELGLDEEGRSALLDIGDREQPGWFEARFGGAGRVGQHFRFEPFGWSFYVTEVANSFYTEIRQITYQQLVILVVATAAALILVWLFARYLGSPIEQVTAAMRHIRESNDLSRRVPVPYADEIGVLANEFNEMVASLDTSYRRLRESVAAEQAARRDAAEREYETLLILGRSTEYKDFETGVHLVRVGMMAARLAELAGYDTEFCDLLYHAAPLHDVGKIGIPDRVLLKPGPLDTEERAVIEQHPVIGHRILSTAKSRYLREGATIALTHHERWDGAGYPGGLKAEMIPSSGRVVALIDVLDALTSERPYKRDWSFDDALAEIERGRGTQFEARLTDVLLEHAEEFARIRTDMPDYRPNGQGPGDSPSS